MGLCQKFKGKFKKCNKEKCALACMECDTSNLPKHIRELKKYKAEFQRFHRYIKYAKPVIVIFTLLVWYILIKYGGFKAFSVFIALLFSMVTFFEFFFLRRIEAKILNPIGSLKNGVSEIARGNYDVEIKNCVSNEIGQLIDSFNEMARKLKEGEKVKSEYEENRKTIIANISHDLKTPMTSIQGYIEAILDDTVISREDLSKYLKIIYSNSEYMNKLIDDLFLFSKLDMQKLDFNFAEVEAIPFFNDLFEEFELEFQERGFKFAYTNKLEENVVFNIDTKRIHQIFRNVIGNAVKYRGGASLSLWVDLYMEKDFVCVDVRDDGRGIGEDKLEHVFDRFYRVDTERTKDLLSTGLGLAIAKELVEAHGGKISASSVEGSGTCFTIRIPALIISR
ncbi:HAMP domain-containing sensor histidine kinase [Acetivibrio cellulolyticus]|uniref:HAMP domain-containing sensor histidine kinase n=1 Tax=Acetivibrio cellulolyticus TaxID=35830 RepID=UPI0001E2C6BA|nr:HAMP domain-containing sensor histidine kinase [Acetivibrio cellulolyticus]